MDVLSFIHPEIAEIVEAHSPELKKANAFSTSDKLSKVETTAGDIWLDELDTFK
jgi:hypothetical protein